MNKKSLDICITTYNRNNKLLQTLDILGKQSNMDFNLIINDDGNKSIINPNDYPIITKYIWNKDDGYHRVGRFNESVSLCVSPFVVIMDDDCVPVSINFVQSYISLLNQHQVVKGLVKFSNGSLASSWFSTANLGVRLKLIKKIGLFDKRYDGHYGFEDIDLGKKYDKFKIAVVDGDNNTLVNHGDELYLNGDRSEAVTGHNKAQFIKKWG